VGGGGGLGGIVGFSILFVWIILFEAKSSQRRHGIQEIVEVRRTVICRVTIIEKNFIYQPMGNY
jgi:hypothetical protein